MVDRLHRSLQTEGKDPEPFNFMKFIEDITQKYSEYKEEQIQDIITEEKQNQKDIPIEVSGGGKHEKKKEKNNENVRTNDKRKGK